MPSPKPQSATVQIFDTLNQPFRLESWPMPEQLAAGEVLVEISLATICGSDLHTISGQRQEPTPCILGHEAVGRVVHIGQDRPNLNIGDRVTWSMADSCGQCVMCTEYQLPQKCQHLFKYGHAAMDNGTGLNGCYASHILLRAGTHIVKVPDSLPDNVIVPANCALATVVNMVSQLPDECNSVVIQGVGLLGLYACALLHQQGVKHIFCVDINQNRLAQVPNFGGIPINGQPDQYGEERKKILAVAEPGVDAVLEIAGVAALVPEGLRLLRIGGTYGFVGMVHPNSQLEITGEQIIRKNLTVYGIHNYAPWHLDEAVQFLANTVEKYPFDQLVSPPYTLEDLPTAIEIARSQDWLRVSVHPE